MPLIDLDTGRCVPFGDYEKNKDDDVVVTTTTTVDGTSRGAGAYRCSMFSSSALSSSSSRTSASWNDCRNKLHPHHSLHENVGMKKKNNNKYDPNSNNDNNTMDTNTNGEKKILMLHTHQHQPKKSRNNSLRRHCSRSKSVPTEKYSLLVGQEFGDNDYNDDNEEDAGTRNNLRYDITPITENEENEENDGEVDDDEEDDKADADEEVVVVEEDGDTKMKKDVNISSFTTEHSTEGEEDNSGRGGGNNSSHSTLSTRTCSRNSSSSNIEDRCCDTTITGWMNHEKEFIQQQQPQDYYHYHQQHYEQQQQKYVTDLHVNVHRKHIKFDSNHHQRYLTKGLNSNNNMDMKIPNYHNHNNDYYTTSSYNCSHDDHDSCGDDPELSNATSVTSEEEDMGYGSSTIASSSSKSVSSVSSTSSSVSSSSTLLVLTTTSGNGPKPKNKKYSYKHERLLRRQRLIASCNLSSCSQRMLCCWIYACFFLLIGLLLTLSYALYHNSNEKRMRDNSKNNSNNKNNPFPGETSLVSGHPHTTTKKNDTTHQEDLNESEGGNGNGTQDQPFIEIQSGPTTGSSSESSPPSLPSFHSTTNIPILETNTNTATNTTHISEPPPSSFDDTIWNSSLYINAGGKGPYYDPIRNVTWYPDHPYLVTSTQQQHQQHNNSNQSYNQNQPLSPTTTTATIHGSSGSSLVTLPNRTILDSLFFSTSFIYTNYHTCPNNWRKNILEEEINNYNHQDDTQMVIMTESNHINNESSLTDTQQHILETNIVLFCSERWFTNTNRLATATNITSNVTQNGSYNNNNNDTDTSPTETETTTTTFNSILGEEDKTVGRYEIPVPNGFYHVQLYFNEIYYTNVNQRVFTIQIEEIQHVWENVDILQEIQNQNENQNQQNHTHQTYTHHYIQNNETMNQTGSKQEQQPSTTTQDILQNDYCDSTNVVATVVTLTADTVMVVDQFLTIEFIPIEQQAKINAIEIHRIVAHHSISFLSVKTIETIIFSKRKSKEMKKKNTGQKKE